MKVIGHEKHDARRVGGLQKTAVQAFFILCKKKDEVKKDGNVVERPKKTGFLGATGLLLYCPSCTGVWLAAMIIYVYIFLPPPLYLLIVFILALSAIERILSNILGWFKGNS